MAAQIQRKVDLLDVYRVRYRQFNAVPHFDPRYSHHFPFFGFGTIELMMRDGRIRFGLGMLKGPIYAFTKFFSQEKADDPAVNQAIIDQQYLYPYKVVCDDKKTEEFILKQLNKFWVEALPKALKCIEWGFSPHQVIYERIKDQIHFKTLIPYSPQIARPVIKKNNLIGVHLKNTDKYIPLPKSAVFVHQREINQFVGQSRLLGCHIPWHETWQLGGARDIRRMWYFKNAYDSGTLYFPEGSVTDENGITRANVEIAMEIMEAMQTGSYRVLPKPNTGNGKNDKTWDYEPPKGNTTPDGLLDYPADLRLEILEGLGIPREVVESSGSQGFGSASGRAVPMMAFIASLVPIVSETLTDFRNQILNPCLKVNGLSEDYDIESIIPVAPQAQPGEPGEPAPVKKPSEES